MFTKEELLSLRKQLPRGSYAFIAIKCNCSYDHVRNVLHAKSTDIKVINASIDIVKKHKQNIRDAKNKINKINE